MIRAVQKAARILTIISDGKTKPVTLSDISTKAGINKSTCSHIISTLAEEGFVKRISHSKGYVLGPEAYCLSRFGKYDDEFVTLCHPVINWLYKKVEHTTILAVVEAGKKFTIDHFDTSDKTLPDSYEIMPDDIYRTATGRIIMANMESSEVQDVFKKNGLPPKNHWDNITSLEDLKAKLSEIDKKSIIKTTHKQDDSDYLSIGYAAAIFKHTKCVGAIGVAVKLLEADLDDFLPEENEIKKHIITARTEIGRRLKYS